MPRKSRLLLGLALSVAAALVATGCSPSTPDAPAAPETNLLAIGVQAPPNSLDPAQLHDGQQRYVWASIYDTLLLSENDGTISGGAAESWEYSDDALTLTLTLRDGMTFSSGADVDAEAVKVTLERTRDTAGPQQNNLSAIDSIDTPDPLTVVLNLSRTDPNLLVALSYGAGVITDPATIDSDTLALDPVGSGPYTLNRDRSTDGSVYVLERRDDYWNVEAYPFTQITVRAISDRTALFNTLLAGEVDAASVDLTQAPQAESSGLTLTTVEGISVGSLILADRAGTVAPELADIRVRQAINMAFDRQGIIDAILLGNGSPGSQPFNPISPVYNDQLDDLYPFDPEAARELLADAGYPNGFTLAMPANLVVMQFQPTITQSLADIGITVQWDPVPASSSGQGTTWGAYFNYGSIAPASRISALYYQANGSQNPFRYEDETVNALLADVADETDLDIANETYRKLNDYTMEQAWFAPLFLQNTTWATADNVEYVGTSGSMPDIRVFGSPDGD